MALTINHKPQLISPVYNDLMFIVSTDMVNFTNLKFSVKVYYAGTLLKTLRYDRWPHGSYIQADVHRILESRFSYSIKEIATTTTGFVLPGANGESFIDYKVEFAEEVSGNVITSGVVSATGLYAFNGAFKYLDWINYNYSNYNLQTGSQHKFLTNSPRTVKIRDGEAAELGFISLAKEAEKAKITTYDVSGNIITSITINNSIYGGTSDSKSQSLNFMCGPHNLSGTGVITDAVAKYTVELQNDSDQTISEVFTFIIDRQCSRHQLYRLHFLNRWGRFDSFTFKGSHRHNVRFERSNYQKFTGYTDLTTSQWTNNAQARGTVNFDTRETEQYTLTSDWITEEESVWLQELAGSPVVFWQVDAADSSKTIAVNITDDSYEVKNYGNKKLFSLSLTMQLAQPNYRQRA